MYFAAIAHTPLASVLVVAIGLVAGSFVNCWAYRCVHGGSILHGRSVCASCGHELGAAELVPVVSWLVQRGTCRHCGKKISARYPATEVVSAVMLLGIAWRPSSIASDALWLAETIELSLFACILLYVSLTDLDDLLIPNGAILAALAVRAAYLVCAFALGAPDAASMAASSAVGGVVLGGGLLVLVLLADRVLGRDSMGGGDIKLMFVAGCYFGWQLGLLCLLLACVVGILLAAVAHFAPAGDATPSHGPGTHSAEVASDPAEGSFMRKTMPFGPAIAIACWIAMIWGPGILGAYLALFQ